MRGLGGFASGGRILSRGCSEGSVTIVPGDTSAVFCEVGGEADGPAGACQAWAGREVPGRKNTN